MGMALMGTGIAKGENRALEAAQRAISSPLLEETSIEGAKGVLINISGGRDLTLHEVDEAARIIQSAVDPDANIISGMVIDETLDEEMKVTVIATGFRCAGEQHDAPGLAVPHPAARPSGAAVAHALRRPGRRRAARRRRPSRRRPRAPPTCPSTARCWRRARAATIRAASGRTGRTSTTTTSRPCCASRWTDGARRLLTLFGRSGTKLWPGTAFPGAPEGPGNGVPGPLSGWRERCFRKPAE